MKTIQDILNSNDPHQAIEDTYLEDSELGKLVSSYWDEAQIDNRLHPDDDFEDITAIAYERLVQDYE